LWPSSPPPPPPPPPVAELRPTRVVTFSCNGVQVVREAQAELPEGPVVTGGGPEAPRLHSPPWPRLLERAPCESR
jgi:hypothetical protein